MTHPAAYGVDRYGQAEATLALIHFFPLSLMWTAAAIFDRPLVNDAFGPVILSLWVEQWVAPPAIGAFMVVLGVFNRSWDPMFRAVLRFIGSIILCLSVLAFGVAGFWASSMMPIFVYSITTPPFVAAMAWVAWRDVWRGLHGRAG